MGSNPVGITMDQWTVRRLELLRPNGRVRELAVAGRQSRGLDTNPDTVRAQRKPGCRLGNT